MSIGPRARRAFAVCALALVIATAVTTAVRAIRGDRHAVAAGGPVPTVRQFLADAVVDDDGFQACRFLTPAEQKRVALRGATARSCGEALDRAQLRLGDKTYATIRAIYGDLDAGAVQPDGRAIVRIRHGGRSHSFVLVPATPSQRIDYGAPAMPWRIDRGAATLIPRMRG